MDNSKTEAEDYELILEHLMFPESKDLFKEWGGHYKGTPGISWSNSTDQIWDNLGTKGNKNNDVF